ncbi:MAG: peptidoglycan DD-metalloendopeptidase family protein [Lachnospiraceae bacterium]|nr:peptidoglycan DD-metalloendopeptidase family protein [Lachnospiraceae bacterium]
MKNKVMRAIKQNIALLLTCTLVMGTTGVALADPETEIDINNPPPSESAEPESEPQIVEERQDQTQDGTTAQPRISAALDAANKAVAAGNQAVDQAKNEKTQMENSLQKAEETKKSLIKDREQLNAAVFNLDSQMQDVTINLSEVEDLLSRKEQELSETTARLIQARADATDQYEEMKIRIKYMYEKGTADFVQILLGAGSFAEMLNKAEYIEQISSYDRTMLEQYEQTKKDMADLEDVLSTQQEVLEQTKAEVESKRSEMETLINEKSAEIIQYNKDIKNKEEAIAEYEAMIVEQDTTIKELEKAADAARKRQMAAVAAESGMSVSGNYVVSFGGGQFCWPAPAYTRISDDYGMRIHPILGIQKFHNGVDMAAPSGSPILAAADGYVVAAAYSGSMGNYVMIDHGSGVYTIYMHASALYVSANQSVKKGDTIAAVGSTGRSTGAHLHFSVRVNGQYVSPWQYL